MSIQIELREVDAHKWQAVCLTAAIAPVQASTPRKAIKRMARTVARAKVDWSSISARDDHARLQMIPQPEPADDMTHVRELQDEDASINDGDAIVDRMIEAGVPKIKKPKPAKKEEKKEEKKADKKTDKKDAPKKTKKVADGKKADNN